MQRDFQMHLLQDASHLNWVALLKHKGNTVDEVEKSSNVNFSGVAG